MNVEELEKFLLNQIKEARELSHSYGVGAFLSGKASGIIHLSEQILKMIREPEKENSQT